MGLHEGPPPFDLVQLSTVPQEQWKGLPVFHPGEQRGDNPKWTFQTNPVEDLLELGRHEQSLYDVGVVIRWEPDPDFADMGAIRVHFIGSRGSVLHYDATNLWVPKSLVIHPEVPEDLRAQGWTVAIHNDYRLNDESHTFWLLTKGNFAVKGEGKTDAEALEQIRRQLPLRKVDA